MDLDFRLLDDIEYALPRRREKVDALLPHLRSTSLGPALAFFRQHRFQADILIPQLLRQQPMAMIAALIEIGTFDRMASDSGEQPHSSEVSWLPHCDGEFDDARWKLFLKRFNAAAQAAGFPSQQAAVLGGAFREIADNVVQHSEAPETGICGYAWRTGYFELAVHDLGIGIRRSMRTNSRYAHIDTDPEALELAVQPAVSRFDGENRGWGFREVVRALSSLFGHIRVQSGLAALDIEGESPTYSQATVRDGFEVGGTLVAVVARPA